MLALVFGVALMVWTGRMRTFVHHSELNTQSRSSHSAAVSEATAHTQKKITQANRVFPTKPVECPSCHRRNASIASQCAECGRPLI